MRVGDLPGSVGVLIDAGRTYSREPTPVVRSADYRVVDARVVLLISNLEFGGAQRQVIELANEFNARGGEAHVCCLSDYVPLASSLHASSRFLHVVAKRSKFDVSVVPRLARLLRLLDADLVHSFLFDAEISARLAGALLGRVAVVGSERNTDYTRKWRHTVALRACSQLFDAVIANSTAGKRFQMRTLGIPSRQIHVVPNGVDVTRFVPRAWSGLRTELSIADGSRVVGLFGSFKRQKNHAMFFRMARRALDMNPGLVFVCVGAELHGGLLASGEHEHRMHALVDSLGLTDAVRFLGNREDVIDAYNACDVTVLTSWHEGTPNVLLESMACEVPVVATDVSDNAVVVPDGKVGYIVPSDDDATMAERVVRLCANDKARKAMGRAASQWVASRYSIASMAMNTSEVYRDVLQRKRRRLTRCAAMVAGQGVSSISAGPACPDVAVSLRKYPHPYASMLAICSDLDETPDRRVYLEIARFLNTTADTCMGPGVGMEVGNTIYFDMPQGQFSYWGTDDEGRAMVRALIASGHIDCLHSYGDFAAHRADAERNIEELVRHHCHLEVWVDHSKSPSNFGPDIMVGSGDVVDAPAYHADLTHHYGIRYVWRGRTTGVTGQDVPIGLESFLHFFNPSHALASTRTMVKEATKVFLGRRKHPRWEMYAANRVCRPSRLRDGRSIWEFLRSNPYWAGSGHGETASGVGHVLTRRMLERLIRSHGACVLYTHLGKIRDPRRPFDDRARAAFRELATMHRSGKVFVTTTHRLLRYITVRDSLRYGASRAGDTLVIRIESVDDPVGGSRVPTEQDLQGLTFTIKRADKVEIGVVGQGNVPCEIRHCGDTTQVSIPWRPLRFPDV